MNHEYHNQIEHLVIVALDFICGSACNFGWVLDLAALYLASS